MVGQESLWQVAHRVHEIMHSAAIPHAIVGGVAVCLHGYRRTTIDLDLLVRPGDADAIRESLISAGYEWSPSVREFRSADGIPVQFVLTGHAMGPKEPTRFPDPSDPGVTVALESLPTLSLAKLIEAKLACGQGNLRRTHKDFADVVELIAANCLKASFVSKLHPSVRPAYRELWKRVDGTT